MRGEEEPCVPAPPLPLLLLLLLLLLVEPGALKVWGKISLSLALQELRSLLAV